MVGGGPSVRLSVAHSPGSRFTDAALKLLAAAAEPTNIRPVRARSRCIYISLQLTPRHAARFSVALPLLRIFPSISSDLYAYLSPRRWLAPIQRHFCSSLFVFSFFAMIFHFLFIVFHIFFFVCIACQPQKYK